MKKYYDIVIIGAGIAGLECANQLKDSDLKILLLEKNKKFYNKCCAQGILQEDLEFIDKKYLFSDFKPVTFKYNKNKIYIGQKGIISTFDKVKFLKNKLQNIKKNKNINFNFIKNYNILNNNQILIDFKNKKKKIGFKYLIGADGSISRVRRLLGLGNTKQFLALQYLINKKSTGFIIEFDNNLFGYFWRFPLKNKTIIGVGLEINQKNIGKLKQKLKNYLKKYKIDQFRKTFSGALINYDYQGYKFAPKGSLRENIYLAGDAAGLASGLTGKGIYAAHLSAKQIASDILGFNKDYLSPWLNKKKNQEKYLKFIKTKTRRRVFMQSAIKLSQKSSFKKKIESII